MADSARDWTALPRDVLFDIFLKLGPREILLGAEFTCTAWRRVAVEEPALWRRIGWETIDYQYQGRWISNEAEMAIERVSVERSAGQCEAFKGDLDYEDLPDLVGRAPDLKTLDITCFDNYEGIDEVIVALRKLPLLQNLQIYFPVAIEPTDEVFKSVCQACPNLKELVLNFANASLVECLEDDFSMELIDVEIPLMHELRILKMYECDLSAKGLNGILDSCPLLECLHIEGYFNKHDMDDELQVKCARIKDLNLPSTLNYQDRCNYEYFGYPNSDLEEDY